MINRAMEEKEINVKVGDRVISHGNKGTVTKVYHGCDKKWNGKEYVNIPGTEFTQVDIHFDEDSELIRNGYIQYQDGTYGEYYVLD